MNFFRKTAVFLAASLVAVSCMQPAYAADWETHWAADYISSARNAGWADMREKNNFEPSAYALREEVTYMLYASQLNYNTVLYMELSDDLSAFSDSSQINSKYRNSFSTLVGNGMISGYSDGTLKPKEYVTRAEMARLVSFLIPEAVLSKNYSGFSDELPNWAALDIERCARAGIISGYPDGTFRPSGYVTRGEAVRMIQSLREFISLSAPQTQETPKNQYPSKDSETPAAETTTEAATETLAEESTETTTYDGDTHVNDMSKVKSLAELISNKRIDEGSPEIKMDEALNELAFLKAKDMYKTNYNQVYTTSYGALDQVLAGAGIRFSKCDMVIANGIYAPYDALSSFEQNDSYNSILLDNDFTRYGVGVYEDRWAVIFVRYTND